jgi:hypothetical protein
MWYMQRNDVNLRNEWTNYTNFPYSSLPSKLTYHNQFSETGVNNDILYLGVNPKDQSITGIGTTGNYQAINQREILQTMGIILDGDYRENLLTSGIFNYIEKYVRTPGFAQEGLYCYNFCLNTNPFDYQPSGALNLSKFKNIQLEVTTHIPPIDPINSAFGVICGTDGNPIGLRKSNWQLYDYNYNMTLFEERYNVLSFISGNCGMLYAR